MNVKVWNDSSEFDWSESFKGEQITIPKGKFIEMELYEANDFRGQFSPIKLLGDGTQDPKSLKKIRVERLTQEQLDTVDENEVYQCNLCKKTYTSEASLLKHSEKTHTEQMVVDAEAEIELPKKRGRPRKDA